MLKAKKKIIACTPFSKGLRKGCALFGVIVLLFVLLCFPVSASQNSNNTFILSCGRPCSSPGTGYVEILIKDTSGKFSVRTFMWSLSDNIASVPDSTFLEDVGVCPQISIVNNSSGNDGITFYCPRVSDGVKMDIYTMNNASSFNETSVGYAESKSYYTYSTSLEIVSYHLYGQYNLTTSGTFTKEEFYVLYAQDGVIYNAISKGQQEQTNQIISGQQQQTEDITQNQNENTDKITQNQDKNTQDVIDNQNQLVENERNEANDTAGGGVNDVLSIIPNDSEGLIDSFTLLTDVLTYNGVSSYFGIPRITIPAIGGYFDEVTIIEETAFDISTVINIFPDSILDLVRSMLTLGLLIYCFKELYSITSYVFTLKGGNMDE